MRRSQRDHFEEEDYSAFDGAPKRRRRTRTMGAGRWFAGIVAAAAFAALVARAPDHAAVPAPRPFAHPAWVDTATSDELFAMPAAAVSGLPLNYAIDRAATGPGRQDVLTYGRPGSEHGYVRLEIRHAMAPGPDVGLFVALVRRAADAGLAVTRAGQAFTLPTRLGPLEASEVTLAADAREWPCLGMRLRSTDTRLTIVALACGEAGKRPTPAATACILDSLGLAPGSDDPALHAFFEEAARRRGSACRMTPPDRPTTPVPQRAAAGTGQSFGEPPAAAADVRRRGGRRRAATIL